MQSTVALFSTLQRGAALALTHKDCAGEEAAPKADCAFLVKDFISNSAFIPLPQRNFKEDGITFLC